jgi:hypothetical protein
VATLAGSRGTPQKAHRHALRCKCFNFIIRHFGPLSNKRAARVMAAWNVAGNHRLMVRCTGGQHSAMARRHRQKTRLEQRRYQLGTRYKQRDQNKRIDRWKQRSLFRTVDKFVGLAADLTSDDGAASDGWYLKLKMRAAGDNHDKRAIRRRLRRGGHQFGACSEASSPSSAATTNDLPWLSGRSTGRCAPLLHHRTWVFRTSLAQISVPAGAGL